MIGDFMIVVVEWRTLFDRVDRYHSPHIVLKYGRCESLSFRMVIPLVKSSTSFALLRCLHITTLFHDHG